MFASDDEDFNQADSPHPPSNAHVKSTQEILLSYVFAAESRDYVQGMSDLLSPIYVVCEGDQAMAYWAFETLMERMKGNFLRDQSGMKGQLTLLQGLLRTMDVQLYKHLGTSSPPLTRCRRAELTPSLVSLAEECGSLNLFMCFRWLLCSFKRELSFDQTLQLWEVLWTDHLGANFHLFIALAILEAHRDVIIRYLREFDEVRLLLPPSLRTR
jgi:TBC1 domain family member 15